MAGCGLSVATDVVLPMQLCVCRTANFSHWLQGSACNTTKTSPSVATAMGLQLFGTHLSYELSPFQSTLLCTVLLLSTKCAPRSNAPSWFCLCQVYHPNIDLDGNICLNILREDWKPVLSISSIVYGLQFLFLVGSVWGHTAAILDFVPAARLCFWANIQDDTSATGWAHVETVSAGRML